MRAFAEKVSHQIGDEGELRQEVAFREGDFTDYYRASTFGDQSVTFRWAFDSTGDIAAFRVTPTPAPADTGMEGYEVKAKTTLPLGKAQNGMWYTIWGGDDAVHNKHVPSKEQRWAYDFLIMLGGDYKEGAGDRNEQHYCWGQPVAAPADGRIVSAINDVPDNEVVGQINFEQPTGNHVIIDHGNDEYSLIAHFKRGSVTVVEGDEVTRGQILGECGNSGQSSLPLCITT